MYALKTNSKTLGAVYYMNVMMITPDAESAAHFKTAADAQKEVEHFRALFHYEEITPEIVNI